MKLMKIFRSKRPSKKDQKELHASFDSDRSLPFACAANVKIPRIKSSVLQTSEGQILSPQENVTAEDVPQTEGGTETESSEDQKPALPRPVETRIAKGSEEATKAEPDGVVPERAPTTTTVGPEGPSTTSVATTEEPTTPAEVVVDDIDESEEERKKEEEVLRAWGKSQEPKKLPIPTDYPDYMRKVPELVYSETETSILRKRFNLTKIKSYEYQPLKRDERKLRRTPIPKENLTSSLRKRFAGKQPIISQHFERHFNTYSRPPFKNTSLKLQNF